MSLLVPCWTNPLLCKAEFRAYAVRTGDVYINKPILINRNVWTRSSPEKDELTRTMTINRTVSIIGLLSHEIFESISCFPETLKHTLTIGRTVPVDSNSCSHGRGLPIKERFKTAGPFQDRIICCYDPRSTYSSKLHLVYEVATAFVLVTSWRPHS